MVSGHLTTRNGLYYIKLSYYDAERKRRYKTVATGLKVSKNNKRKAEEMLQKTRVEFFVPQSINSVSLSVYSKRLSIITISLIYIVSGNRHKYSNHRGPKCNLRIYISCL